MRRKPRRKRRLKPRKRQKKPPRKAPKLLTMLTPRRNHLPRSERARIADPEGWVSVLNSSNGFRWAVKIREKVQMQARGLPEESCVRMMEVQEVLGTSWKDSLDRVEEAGESYEETGGGLCINGCGQERFGRHPTCCTHCKGPDGPHASDCLNAGYALCVNGCGHPQFGKFETCCTRCQGPEGPHCDGCEPAENDNDTSEERTCEQGCGRAPFRHYSTCCTYCTGPDCDHSRDCESRNPPGGEWQCGGRPRPAMSFCTQAQQHSFVQREQPKEEVDNFTQVVNDVKKTAENMCTIS